MVETLLFCSPGKSYRGQLELEVSKAYTKMASNDFDKMIGFERGYADKFVKNPDYQEKEIILKEGRPVDLSVFAYQPVISVHGRPVKINSFSNIFNVRCDLKDSKNQIYLPDLEVIEIFGSEEDKGLMISAIEDLYFENNGWKVCLYQGQMKEKQIFPQEPNKVRFNGVSIPILDPDSLLRAAKEFVGYDLNKLAWTG